MSAPAYEALEGGWKLKFDAGRVWLFVLASPYWIPIDHFADRAAALLDYAKRTRRALPTAPPPVAPVASVLDSFDLSDLINAQLGE